MKTRGGVHVGERRAEPFAIDVREERREARDVDRVRHAASKTMQEPLFADFAELEEPLHGLLGELAHGVGQRRFEKREVGALSNRREARVDVGEGAIRRRFRRQALELRVAREHRACVLGELGQEALHLRVACPKAVFADAGFEEPHEETRRRDAEVAVEGVDEEVEQGVGRERREAAASMPTAEGDRARDRRPHEAPREHRAGATIGVQTRGEVLVPEGVEGRVGVRLPPRERGVTEQAETGATREARDGGAHELFERRRTVAFETRELRDDLRMGVAADEQALTLGSGRRRASTAVSPSGGVRRRPSTAPRSGAVTIASRVASSSVVVPVGAGGGGLGRRGVAHALRAGSA